QDEDSIRRPLVTGVQTCALPIYRVELWWVRREERGDRLVSDLCNHVVPQSVPDVEEVTSAALEHPKGFAEPSKLIREEHQPELAKDRIERTLLERQMRRIRLPPFQTRLTEPFLAGVRDHRFVQI